MNKNEAGEKYWGKDYMVRVPYDIVWIDPRFGSFLDKVYGDRKKFLDRASSLVSIKKTNEQAISHPTGGRVAIYELGKSYIDPDFNFPCPEIDVKGILLTSSGHRTYAHELVNPQPRREIHRHSRKDDLYGPLSLTEPSADKDNALFARGNGILTHLPGFILIPQKLVFEGKLVTSADIINLFKLPPNSQFAIYGRVYPVTSARCSDLFDWDGNCHQPNVITKDKVFVPNPSIEEADFIKRVRAGREIWEAVEKPRLMKGLNAKNERKFNEDYFAFVYETTVRQIAQMVETGISPASGKESDFQVLCHTHLQNKTGIAAEVEWAPITNIRKLDTRRQFDHLTFLIEEYHSFLINIGMVCLFDWQKIPAFDRLLLTVLELTGPNPLLEDIYAKHCTEDGYGPGNDVFKLLRSIPKTEDQLKDAISLSHRIV